MKTKTCMKSKNLSKFEVLENADMKTIYGGTRQMIVKIDKNGKIVVELTLN